MQHNWTGNGKLTGCLVYGLCENLLKSIAVLIFKIWQNLPYSILVRGLLGDAKVCLFPPSRDSLAAVEDIREDRVSHLFQFPRRFQESARWQPWAGSQPVNPVLGGAPTTSCLTGLQTPSSLTVDTCILSPVLKRFLFIHLTYNSQELGGHFAIISAI